MLLKKDLFFNLKIYMYACVGMDAYWYARVGVGALRGQKRALDALKLELQVVMGAGN